MWWVRLGFLLNSYNNFSFLWWWIDNNMTLHIQYISTIKYEVTLSNLTAKSWEQIFSFILVCYHASDTWNTHTHSFISQALFPSFSRLLWGYFNENVNNIKYYVWKFLLGYAKVQIFDLFMCPERKIYECAWVNGDVKFKQGECCSFHTNLLTCLWEL